MRIDLEEVDNTTVVTETVSQTSKFATNFGIDASIFKKIGLKFGANLENTTTNSLARQYTLNSNQLATFLVNFADNVIISGTTSREYSSDDISISVEPKRVQ